MRYEDARWQVQWNVENIPSQSNQGADYWFWWRPFGPNFSQRDWHHSPFQLLPMSGIFTRWFTATISASWWERMWGTLGVRRAALQIVGATLASWPQRCDRVATSEHRDLTKPFISSIWGLFFSVVASVSLTLSPLSFTSPFLSVFTLADPPAVACLSKGRGIYDPISDTYQESYPQRAPAYL